MNENEEQNLVARSAAPIAPQSLYPEAVRGVLQSDVIDTEHVQSIPTTQSAVRSKLPVTFKIAIVSVAALLAILALVSTMTSYEIAKMLGTLVGPLGLAATLCLGVGLAQMSWKSFKRTINMPSGESEVMPFDPSIKLSIIVILVSVPLVALYGFGALGIIAGIIMMAVAVKRADIISGAKPVPGAVKYIVTGLLLLVGGLSAAAVSFIIYFLVSTRICELSGSSKCL